MKTDSLTNGDRPLKQNGIFLTAGTDLRIEDRFSNNGDRPPNPKRQIL
ncbi:MAG: hypothetical protein LBQ77_07195 [Treponema sp.]|nr:hypothetical protein [Treponema sp.]